MATNFPNSPSNGATHTFGGTTYTYNSTKGVWQASADAMAVSDNPPSNPQTGDLWFDSSVAKSYIYYNDGSSAQWVQLNPSGGSDGADGQDATGGGESPIIYTEPATSVTFATDGTASTVQMQAIDPEGTAITYGLAYANATNSRPSQLSADTTINQSTGTYTFTPSTTLSNEGTFKARLSASDGVGITTRFVNFQLAFPMNATYLVVAGGGSGGVGVSGGGGGAGGLLYSTSGQFPLNTQLTVSVGAGGAAKSGNGDGNAGSNSSITGTGFTALTAIGGGKGGGMRVAPAAGGWQTDLAGGSGGGGSGYSSSGTITGPGGNATAGQGNAGGTGRYMGGPGYGGGGGGAGEAGGNHDASSDVSVGGDGLQYSISGTATYYAGGGGGGGYNSAGKAGGQGGGGPGGHRYGGNGATANATANTGGGGGGAGDGATSGAGGSGIVIIRGPNAYSATGSGFTETTDGSDKIWTFTSTSGGTITFSV